MKRRGFFRALFGGATCAVVPKPKAQAMLRMLPQSALTSGAFISNAFISRYHIDIGRIEEYTRLRGVQ